MVDQNHRQSATTTSLSSSPSIPESSTDSDDTPVNIVPAHPLQHSDPHRHRQQPKQQQLHRAVQTYASPTTKSVPCSSYEQKQHQKAKKHYLEDEYPQDAMMTVETSGSGYEPFDDTSSSQQYSTTTTSTILYNNNNNTPNQQHDQKIHRHSSSSSSPPSSYNHLHGKLSRPRRRTSAVQNYNTRHHRPHHHGGKKDVVGLGHSDCSLASDSSESITSARYSITSNKNNHSRVTRTLLSQQQLHCGSSGSLFGLGSTTSSLMPVDDEYQKHHHHHNEPLSVLSLLYSHQQQHQQQYAQSSSPSSQQQQQPPPLPSLKVIASELVIICSLYCRYTIHSIKKPYQRFRRRFLYGIVVLLGLVFVLAGYIISDFFMDAVDVCTPPPGSYSPSLATNFLQEHYPYPSNANNGELDGDDDEHERPLVEYYVHGRGIGHYARSVAIVERLNRAGVDVRMFLTRAAMWRAMHEDAKSMMMVDDDERDMTMSQNGIIQQHHPRKRGKTTAISVASITPNQSYFDVISHVIERISGDCEVSASSGRYPQLIISDGDFPGMFRAELGGIPAVGIAHGQLFSIAQKPSWVRNVPQLNSAWNKQGILNLVSGFFTEWQIATHFCFLESKYASGTVARAPLRPEVLQMAEARKFARNGKLYYRHHRSLPQSERIHELLFEDSRPATISTQNRTMTVPLPQRKVVICYFRDRNGEIVVQALLDAGFDVLLFDNGYYKDMANDPSRYGVKWVIKDYEKERLNHIRIGEGRRRLLETRDHWRGESDVVHNKKTVETSLSWRPRRRLGEVLRQRSNGPKLIRVTDRSLFVPLMHVADGVASSAGSQLMSECIYSHMPLLALYREEDDEQRLNVELSHHMDAPCHRPLVFGTSFESLSYALKSNDTHYATHHSRSPILESLASFIGEVQKSNVSDTYYRNIGLMSNSGWKNESANEIDEKFPDTVSDEDPFRGLPDAAAIILEIVKQVIQKI